MIRHYATLVLLVSLCTLSISGCGSDPTGQPGVPIQTAQVDLEDSSHPLRVRTEGLVLSVQPMLDRGLAWRIAFESNRPLDRVEAVTADGSACERSVDVYRFELFIRPEQLESALAGEVIYLDLETRTGEQRYYTAMIRIAPRLSAVTGTPLVWLEPELTSYLSADRLVRYRGRALVAERIESLRVLTDNDADPVVERLDDAHWQFDWSSSELQRALASASPAIGLLAIDGQGEQHRLQARLELAVIQLGLTTGDAVEVWPQSCQLEVRRCLDTLHRSTAADSAHCGSAAAVLACLDPEIG
ncbi:MAG: hypothetical protein JXR96_16435 [Deltaproteobacteria bacterium]|nr:hypothetical protein [Deltaproteobacteria bacterium]